MEGLVLWRLCKREVDPDGVGEGTKRGSIPSGCARGQQRLSEAKTADRSRRRIGDDRITLLRSSCYVCIAHPSQIHAVTPFKKVTWI